jgi:hypothetical protein
MIEIIEVEGNELFVQYQGQSQPQPVHVSLDCRTGELSAEYDPEIGGSRPMDVHHGHVCRWRIPVLTAEAANALLADLAPIAQRVVDGYSSEWDGSNHVGRLSDDADDAAIDIDALCDASRFGDGDILTGDDT